jgi:hypothetical protein
MDGLMMWNWDAGENAERADGDMRLSRSACFYFVWKAISLSLALEGIRNKRSGQLAPPRRISNARTYTHTGISSHEKLMSVSSQPGRKKSTLDTSIEWPQRCASANCLLGRGLIGINNVVFVRTLLDGVNDDRVHLYFTVFWSFLLVSLVNRWNLIRFFVAWHLIGYLLFSTIKICAVPLKFK